MISLDVCLKSLYSSYVQPYYYVKNSIYQQHNQCVRYNIDIAKDQYFTSSLSDTIEFSHPDTYKILGCLSIYWSVKFCGLLSGNGYWWFFGMHPFICSHALVIAIAVTIAFTTGVAIVINYCSVTFICKALPRVL